MKKLLLNLFLGLLAFGAFSQTPDNWTVISSDVTIEEETTTVNEGSKSAKVTWTSTDNQDIESDAIDVTGDADYSYSLDVYDDTDAGRVRMVLVFDDGTNVYSNVYSVDQASWQTLNITGTVPTAATTVIIRLRFYDESGFSANGNTATVYVDNAIFTLDGGSNLILNGGFESWPAFSSIVDVNYVSETALDVVYDGPVSSVDPADYNLSGTADITFSAAAVDGSDNTLVHLTGASANIEGDATLDNIADANTNLDFYAGIIPIAHTNQTYSGGIINNDVKATFTGIVSANDEFNNVWIADAEGAYNGILIFDYNFDADVVVGDEILLTAELTQYNNLSELTSPSLIEVISSGNTPYGPSVITADVINQDIAADTDPAEQWEGQLVTIEGAKITKGLDASDYFYSANVGDGTDTFRIGDNVNYQLSDISLSVGSVYNITGVVDYEDGAYRINPRSMDDIEAIIPSIVKAYSISDDAIELMYDKSLTSVDPADYNLSGTADITFSSATIDETNDKMVHLTGASATIDADLTIDNIADANSSRDFYAGIMPIANTNANNPDGTIKEDTLATFTGIVSANDAFNNVWVADAEGAYNGILIYDYDFAGEVAVGDEILFTGILDIYNNLSEIKNPVLVELISSGNTPYGPSAISGADISDAIAADTDPAEGWEGQLVKITNATITADVDMNEGGGHYFYTATDDDGTTTFRIGDNVDYEFANITLDVDASYDITGVVDFDKGAYRINPRSMDDIVASTTGIDDIDEIGTVNVYPNPSNGLFTFEMNASKAGTFNVEIINIQGQVVYEKQITSSGFYQESIDISDKASGLYYIRLNDGQSMKIAKILIQ
ncbi:MAG: T9SS type A sorting domain-containing protein [Bacteroidales bacterium]|jgi:hypothetical protein|nr:T9SS type A sorting domain-containing protein [Bacteroidales bacterium]